MKKTYIEPKSEVCVVTTDSILAASPSFDLEPGTGEDEAAKDELDYSWW